MRKFKLVSQLRSERIRVMLSIFWHYNFQHPLRGRWGWWQNMKLVSKLYLIEINLHCVGDMKCLVQATISQA